MINETKNYFAFFSAHSIVRFSQLLWTNISFLKIFVFTTIKRDPLKHNKADKIWIWNCRLLHFCDFATRNFLSSLIWRKIWAIFKKRTDWRIVMSIESIKIVPFFPVPNEQFPNVPDDFILKLWTVPEISLSHMQNFWFLDIGINARSTPYLEIK